MISVAPIPVGTGQISGVVVTTDGTPRPIRRATVNLHDTDRNAGRAAITDAEGRFAFDRLPTGRYTISTSKPAYIRTTYGARTRVGQGLTLALANGQHQQLHVRRLGAEDLRGALFRAAGLPTTSLRTLPAGAASAGLTARFLGGAFLAGAFFAGAR